MAIEALEKECTLYPILLQDFNIQKYDFQNAFYIVTKLLGLYVEVERTISDVRIDVLVKMEDCIYIFEFKYDQSADEALKQIDDKGYVATFAMDKRRVFKVGVNFNRKKRCNVTEK